MAVNKRLKSELKSSKDINHKNQNNINENNLKAAWNNYVGVLIKFDWLPKSVIIFVFIELPLGR